MTSIIETIRNVDEARIAMEKECAADDGFDYVPMFELVTVEPKGRNVNLYFREGDPVEDAMSMLFNSGLFEEREELPEYSVCGRVCILLNVYE